MVPSRVTVWTNATLPLIAVSGSQANRCTLPSNSVGSRLVIATPSSRSDPLQAAPGRKYAAGTWPTPTGRTLMTVRLAGAVGAPDVGAGDGVMDGVGVG